MSRLANLTQYFNEGGEDEEPTFRVKMVKKTLVTVQVQAKDFESAKALVDEVGKVVDEFVLQNEFDPKQDERPLSYICGSCKTAHHVGEFLICCSYDDMGVNDI